MNWNGKTGEYSACFQRQSILRPFTSSQQHDSLENSRDLSVKKPRQPNYLTGADRRDLVFFFFSFLLPNPCTTTSTQVRPPFGRIPSHRRVLIYERRADFSSEYEIMDDEGGGSRGTGLHFRRVSLTSQHSEPNNNVAGNKRARDVKGFDKVFEKNKKRIGIDGKAAYGLAIDKDGFSACLQLNRPYLREIMEDVAKMHQRMFGVPEDTVIGSEVVERPDTASSDIILSSSCDNQADIVEPAARARPVNGAAVSSRERRLKELKDLVAKNESKAKKLNEMVTALRDEGLGEAADHALRDGMARIYQYLIPIPAPTGPAAASLD